MPPPKARPARKNAEYKDKEKPTQIRISNIEAAKAVASAIRTSLGPRGMDKMIQASNGDVTITNDGATILKQMQVLHPAAKMLVELSKAQDVEAGDGTTSVCVIAGSLLDACQKLLSKACLNYVHVGRLIIEKKGAGILSNASLKSSTSLMSVTVVGTLLVAYGAGDEGKLVGATLASICRPLVKRIHPTSISEAFQKAAVKSMEILEKMSRPLELSDRESLLKSASTSLNSKVVSQYSGILSPIAVDAVLRVSNPAVTNNVDLNDIKIVKKIGGTVEDIELIEGLVFDHKTGGTGGPSKVEKAKVGLIQFCISPPKTDMDNSVIVSDYTQMDRVLREERQYILNIVKQIKKAGCNVLLIQKSILRDAVSDLALHFLAKMKIMVVKDIDREDIEFVTKTLGCRPVASLDHFVAENLGSADLVEEVQAGPSKIVKITGIQNPGQTVTVLIRGSNKLVLEEADRSLHDALCVIRCLVKKRALIAGGGAPEIELSIQLMQYANTLAGMEQYCFRAFAEALEVIPFTLSENAGLNPIATVTELRNRHAQGEKTAGINVRKGAITNILEENVVQPLLVSQSAIHLASETVRSIMKIDDIVNCM